MTRGYPKAAPTRKSAAMSLTLLLHGCRPEQLASFTGASLSASYNVPLAVAEKMLAAVREARG